MKVLFKIKSKFKESFDKYGFPFVGSHWIPHLSIASVKGGGKKIINEFKSRTGCPIIFNTSFNLGGEPLVETLDDACRTLFASEIEYLYLPEVQKLVKIKNP